MATIVPETSRTFSEYLLLPNLTRRDCVPANVDLRAPLTRYRPPGEPHLHLNVPMVSAMMQSVSDDTMAVALARSGGLAFIFTSQPIAAQAEMVRRVKKFKAGFVVSDTNLGPRATVRDLLELRRRTGHTTTAVTDSGASDGRLLGILTGRDYRIGHVDPDAPVTTLMTPFDDLVYGRDGITLSEANNLIWEHRLNCLPVIDDHQHLRYLVFRKDYEQHKENPDELIDQEKRLMVGAGVNTHDYPDRVPALIDAGADVLCIDSSDGFSEFQADCLAWVREHRGDRVRVGAGNVADREGFRYLAAAGADFVKVGVGPGSICITREQKGIGRGQASAVLDVAEARREWLEETGEYVPICADGGIFHDYHITLALAMGADFVMMGRYFARFDESPAPRIRMGTNFVKEYWGEGTNRARNWQRYDGPPAAGTLAFEEGVDGYVPYAGELRDNLSQTLNKLRSTMCNCGAADIESLHRTARLTVVSATSLREGGAHDVILKETEIAPGV